MTECMVWMHIKIPLSHRFRIKDLYVPVDLFDRYKKPGYCWRVESKNKRYSPDCLRPLKEMLIFVAISYTIISYLQDNGNHGVLCNFLVQTTNVG